MKQNAVLRFIKKETVLSVAAVLGAVSCLFVPPDALYAGYFDWRTLALLFSLMAVMAGLRAQGVFERLGQALLAQTGSLPGVLLVLVLLCFFGSMLITNDVALITFVPFTFVVLDMLGPSLRRGWVLPLVCMQTIAANLGSMLTPIGNPQNLYLYGKSGLTALQFIAQMLPYTALALALLVGWLLVDCRRRGASALPALSWGQPPRGNKKLVTLYAVLFALCLLTVAHLLPWPLLLVAVLCAVAVCDKTTLAGVDYSLLLTFAAFFVFIGNLGRLPAFSDWLRSVLAGQEVPVAVLASQVISNVPAALLLSGFTERTTQLIVGTNLGGLGTLIASMASLISFRQIAAEEGPRKGAYFVLFTVSNLVFLAALLALWKLLSLP